MIKRFLYILIISLVLVSPVFSADYYFADDGSDDASCSDCTSVSPCQTLAKIESCLNAGAGNTAYLKMDDTWTVTTNAERIIMTQSNSTIKAWPASGTNKPIINGGGTNFGGYNGYPLVGATGGITGIDIDGLHVHNSYSDGIGLDGDSSSAGDATIQNCTIHDIGWSAVNAYGWRNNIGTITIKNNETYDICNYPEDQGWTTGGWPSSIYGVNLVAQYNKIYNVHGEGIICAGGDCTIEYNDISDTYSIPIYTDPFLKTIGTDIIRYNLIWADTDGDNYAHVVSVVSAIRLDDEHPTSGTNTSTAIEIYGNVVVGSWYGGIDLRNRSGGSNWGSVKAYQNTFIDTQRNYILSFAQLFNAIDIRNNISVVNSDIASSAVHMAVWNTTSYPESTTIGPNFWYGDGYTSEANLPADWRDGTNVFGASNPFTKTSGWRSLTSIPAMSNFTTTGTGDADNSANAAVIGASYDDIVSSVTTHEWSDLPAGDTFDLGDQDIVGGSNWTFGAIIYSGGVTPDDDNPTPDPATWSSAPSADSTSAISMTATTGTDDTPPIIYIMNFDPDADSCLTDCNGAADIGTGGTDSGDQSADTTYTDESLQTNQCYCYSIQMKDSAGSPNTGTASAESSAYTLAAVPGAITFEAEGLTSVEILAHDENGNPLATPATTFAIQCVSTSPADASWESKWIDASGDPQATAQWLTDAAITALTINSMDDGTLYGFQSKAKNGDGTETALGTLSYASTTGAPTPPPLVTGLGIVAAGCVFE